MIGRRTLLVLLLAAGVSAQAPQRRATNIAALTTYPAFHHGRQVVVVGDVATQPNGQIRVSNGVASMRVVFDGSAPDGNDEIRGEFWDLARISQDDPRLTRWPKAG